MRKIVSSWGPGVIAGVSLLGVATAGLAQSPVSADNLMPGLQVCYMDHFVRHIDEMIRQEKWKECKPGEPLPQLNYRTGAGTVLTSNGNDGVMARITGFIHLDKTGSYKFAFESNDGVRLEIGDQMILEDPDVHSDRFSDFGSFDVSEPGWYPLTIRYFERKSTSTLRFFWEPPGTEGTMPLVPAEALGHSGS
ncbi:PA14 domain-containing protein [Marinobacterium aestuariivivens]|uniref:PA14 domain-containing protein n=1 Tax=Marinobacterium aestuariivivens TaxID=1698799 RepID=A0ABW2A5Q2_9GAMM